MIRTIRHKGLRELFESGRTRQIDSRQHKVILEALDFLDEALSTEMMAGYRGFHALKGQRKGQYAIKVTANFRMTFEIADGDDASAIYIEDVDYEDYH